MSLCYPHSWYLNSGVRYIKYKYYSLDEGALPISCTLDLWTSKTWSNTIVQPVYPTFFSDIQKKTKKNYITWKNYSLLHPEFKGIFLTKSVSVQSLSHVCLFAIPWIAACQASLSITNSWSPPKPMFIESVMPSNHLILCRPLFLLPSIFPSIRVFSNESALRIRWPKYWSHSFNISPSN